MAYIDTFVSQGKESREIYSIFAFSETRFFENEDGTDFSREQLRTNISMQFTDGMAEKYYRIIFRESDKIEGGYDFKNMLTLSGNTGLDLNSLILGRPWVSLAQNISAEKDSGTSIGRNNISSSVISGWKDVNWLTWDEASMDTLEYITLTAETVSGETFIYVGYDVEVRQTPLLDGSVNPNQEEFRIKLTAKSYVDYFKISSLLINPNKFHVRETLLGYFNGPPGVTIEAEEYGTVPGNPKSGWGSFILINQRITPLDAKGGLMARSEYEWQAYSDWNPTSWAE